MREGEAIAYAMAETAGMLLDRNIKVMQDQLHR